MSGAAGGFVARELTQGRLQSRFFSWLAADVRYAPASGPSPTVRFPEHGPYDVRLGYTRIPAFLARLREEGVVVEAQARWSDRLARLHALGLFPAYPEKDRAGLRILGRRGRPLYDATWPTRAYPDFESIPPVIVRTLLFIENRDLLAPGSPLRNPAVEWERLAYALLQAGLRVVDPDRPVPGASTLATQIEKYRHSPHGLTLEPLEKLRQMVSASVRAYLDGPDTSEARRRIVLAYVNTLPLGAVAGHGEVFGVPEGLWAWFGADPEAMGELLAGAATVPAGDPRLEERAIAFKRVLALLLGQRRPGEYFIRDRDALRRLVDDYLRLLPPAVVSPALREAALAAPLAFADGPDGEAPAAIADRKGADAVRFELLERLGVDRLYTLDRLDLTVESTIDTRAQAAVTEALRALATPAGAAAAGLDAPRLVAAGDPAQVAYSFTLFERAGGAHVLRVHTDTLDGPFSLNDGMKLELGSTAKLRTLITYLELVAEVHGELVDRTPAELRALLADGISPRDRLGRWVAERLLARPGEDLAGVLEAAMERRYSASPRETFFTGGGVHRFHNYGHRYDRAWPTVRESFRYSVNLPFVRLMRDIVDHLVHRDAEITAMLAREDHPLRRIYLERFADYEGSVFLGRFHRRYRGLDPDDALDRLLDRARPSPEGLSVIFRTVRPRAGVDQLAAVLRARLPGHRLEAGEVRSLWERHGPDAFDLQDRGYIAGVHPLELWTVAWLRRRPGGGRAELVADGADERRAVYDWLLDTSRKHAQDQRIRIVLEREAFREIHRRWRRLGYPFERLVPSLATALGSSGDRPTALAELVGIVKAGGVRLPSRRIERLRFGAGTPYETVVRATRADGERVLPAAVAKVVEGALRSVVADGTASRVEGAFARHGLVVGGKTGTGDNRRQVFDARGRLVREEVRNRTATLAFYIGDRWFGVVTAHVAGPAAADYDFTSALPTQVLRALAPHLAPIFDEPAEPGPVARVDSE